MKRPLVMPTFVYVGGILLGNWLALPIGWLLATGVVLAAVAIGWPRGRMACLWPLLLCAGWTNEVRQTAIISPNDLRSLIQEPTIATLRGTLRETPYQRVFEHGEIETWRTIAFVEVTALQGRSTPWREASGTVAVSTPGILPREFFGGREVEISGVLSPPKPPQVPGAFDYATYLRRQGIYFQFRADGPADWRTAPVESRSVRPPLADRFAAWAKHILGLGLPVEDEPLRLLWTMTLGWKTGLTTEVSEPFMRSGTMHIFAISGLHIALIAGILVALLRVLQVPRAICGVVVIPLIWAYTGVTGWQASAIRSTVMMTIIIAGWSMRRPSDLLNSLAAAALIILVWDPQQIFQASFQLSFFVVLSLGLFSPVFQAAGARWLEPDPLRPAELRPRWQRWLGKPLYWLAASLATSLAAWVGSIPLIAFYFNLLTPVSLLANLIVVPISSLALMSNLASLLVGGWFPACAALFNHTAWLCMWLMIHVSEWCAALPGGCFHVGSPSPLTFVIYYTALISLAAGWLTRPIPRRWVLAALAVLGLAWLLQWHQAQSSARVTVLPLSGGSAVYAHDRFGRDEMLVDCGSRSAAEFTVKPFLRYEGISRLDKLVLTHGDVRQMGGAEFLEQTFHPRQFLISPIRFRSPNYRQMLESIGQDKARWQTIQAGARLGPWHVLHPQAEDKFTQADDATIVLRGELQGVRVLLLSDLGRRGQEALLQRQQDLRSDLVIAGLPTQGEPLCEGLLAAVQPSVIVIADSEYPANRRASARLRERLAQSQIPVIYTRETGAAEFKLREGRWEVTTMNGPRLTGTVARSAN